MLKPLSIVTIILVLIGVTLFSFHQPQDSQTQTGTQLLAELSTEELTTIKIQGEEGSIELLQTPEGQWLVESIGYAASSSKIKEMLLQLLDTKLGDQITNKATQHQRLELVDIKDNSNQWEAQKTATTLTLYQGEIPILNLLLGKTRTNGDGQYIRYAGEDAVYLIAEKINLDPIDEDWLQTDLIDIQAKQILGLTLQRSSGERFEFSRDNATTSWQLAQLKENETILTEGIEELLEPLNQISFEKLEKKEIDPSRVGRTNKTEYRLRLDDGRSINVSVGEEETTEDQLYFLSIEMVANENTSEELQKEVIAFNQRNQDYLFGVSSWVGKKYLKTRSDVISTP